VVTVADAVDLVAMAAVDARPDVVVTFAARELAAETEAAVPLARVVRVVTFPLVVMAVVAEAVVDVLNVVVSIAMNAVNHPSRCRT